MGHVVVEGTASNVPRKGVWEPLLVGDAADRGQRVLAGIAKRIVAPVDDPSLGTGTAGIALFRAYLSGTGRREATASGALDLARASMISATRVPDPTLYGGLVGPAWVVSHLDGRFGRTGDSDAIDVVDGALLALLRPSPWMHDFDLISGLVGLGVYALCRLPRPAAVECLELVVERLGEVAETRDDGITWRTRPELLPDWLRRQAPDGCYNVGLAHGVPGVIALLGSARAVDVAPATASRLLDGSVAWVLAQECRDGGPRFPAWILPDGEASRGPLHWCYGDPGVAGAIFAAGDAADRPEWTSAAVDVALRTAGRAADETAVVEPGICHGSAGLGHIYNRFWQATGDARFSVAARLWLERTPALLGGTSDAGFLEGTAGIGLVLLSALGVHPEWDTVLGLSAPSRSGDLSPAIVAPPWSAAGPHGAGAP